MCWIIDEIPLFGGCLSSISTSASMSDLLRQGHGYCHCLDMSISTLLMLDLKCLSIRMKLIWLWTNPSSGCQVAVLDFLWEFRVLTKLVNGSAQNLEVWDPCDWFYWPLYVHRWHIRHPLETAIFVSHNTNENCSKTVSGPSVFSLMTFTMFFWPITFPLCVQWSWFCQDQIYPWHLPITGRHLSWPWFSSHWVQGGYPFLPL